jgi:hypothetical protein
MQQKTTDGTIEESNRSGELCFVPRVATVTAPKLTAYPAFLYCPHLINIKWFQCNCPTNRLRRTVQRIGKQKRARKQQLFGAFRTNKQTSTTTTSTTATQHVGTQGLACDGATNALPVARLRLLPRRRSHRTPPPDCYLFLIVKHAHFLILLFLRRAST